jgi:hypothetical protein
MLRKTGLFVAAACLLTTAAAQGAIWESDFSNWTGTDAASVSSYTDINGMNPRSFVTDAVISPSQEGVPWLSQGDVGGNKTANFNNIATDPATTGRVRFRSNLPGSMRLDTGVSVAWDMRVGADNAGRGPIQIAATLDGQPAANQYKHSAYIRLRNSGHESGNSYIDIQRNGGGLYSDRPDNLLIERLVLDSNLTDEFHQWTAFAIHNPDDDYRNEYGAT